MKIKTLLLLGSITVSSIALNFMPVQRAQAANLITNGGFADATYSGGSVTSSVYLDNTVTLPGWTFSTTTFDNSGRNGYNFLVHSGTQFNQNLSANNPCNPPYSGSCGGTAGLFGSSGQTVVAPGGSGWFIAADAHFERGAINQTLNNLTIGQQYVVSFYQASGQQNYLTDPNTSFTEHFDVSFGGITKQSNTMAAAGLQPVSPWSLQSLTFTANASTQVLSFLAQSQNDVPPFALLSDVSVEAVSAQSASVEAVPEPETYFGTLIGLSCLGTVIKSRSGQKQLTKKD